MPAVFMTLFYDKLTGKKVDFCRIFKIRKVKGEEVDKVAISPSYKAPRPPC